MTAIKVITYAESREAFFAKKLKQAERALDNVVKYGTDPDACAEKGEIVSFYQDVLSSLREKAERMSGCDFCLDPDGDNCNNNIYIDHTHRAAITTHDVYAPINFCPMCGRELKPKEAQA